MDKKPRRLKKRGKHENSGLIRAAESLSFFMKEKIDFAMTDDQDMPGQNSSGIPEKKHNIISASVITQFSNMLKIKAHGGVPQLRKVNFQELNEFVKFETEKNMYIIRFKTNFVSSKINFRPEFLWFFDLHFIGKVRQFQQTQKMLKD